MSQTNINQNMHPDLESALEVELEAESRAEPEESIWRARSTTVIALFATMCVAASFMPNPWHAGTLLPLSVEWPKSLQKLGLVETSVEAPPAPEALAEEEALPETPVEVETEAARRARLEAETRERARAERLRQNRRELRQRVEENAKIMASLKPILKKVGKPAVALERPCIVKDGADGCSLRALDSFFRELRTVALEQRDAPVRIAQFGDSLISGDSITGELRRRFQREYGDGGHGYIPLRAPTRFMGFDGVRVRTSDEGWKMDVVVRGGRKQRPLGVAGVSFRRSGDPNIRVQARDRKRTFDRIGLLYSAAEDEKPGTLSLQAGKASEAVTMPEKATAPTMRWVELKEGSPKFKLSKFKGGGTYYGLFVENAGSGVVVDNMGMLSARMSSLMRIQPKHWQSQLTARGVNLASFAFGVNSAYKRKPSKGWLGRYKKIYGFVLGSALSPRDRRDCMVLSMLTRGLREESKIREYPSVPHIVKAQREIALESGCAFWNMNEVIGGAKGVSKWYHGRPRLLSSDLTHPTRAGYRRLGRRLYAALMYEFMEYLRQDTRAARVALRQKPGAEKEQ